MTRATLDRNINTLQDELLILESMVKEATLQAVDALLKKDLDASRAVYMQDRQINKRRFDIELDCLITIATHQPIASDLRMLASILEIAGELERMGDYAKGIARVTMMLDEKPLPEASKDIPQMASVTIRMLEQSIQAFLAKDAAAAREIPKQDDEVDQFFNQIYRNLVRGMIVDPSTIDESNHLQWAAHNLERMADRVTNICERTIFAAEGTIIELDRSDDEWQRA